MLAAAGFFSRNGLANTGFRWFHVVVAIVWMGMLYYFNFVQGPALAELEKEEGGARVKALVITTMARRALWWFRWAAFATFVTGMLLMVVAESYFNDQFGDSSAGLAISTGMFLGIIMMLNVWGVIWRCQMVVLADAVNQLNGEAPDPAAAVAARKAFMVSRQNVVFSLSTLFFMVYKTHGPLQNGALTSADKGLWWGITMLLIVVLEANALGFAPWKTAKDKGLNVLYDGPGPRNSIIASTGLWAVFLLLTEIVYR